MLGKTNQIFKKIVYAGIFASILLAGAAGKAISAPDSNSIVIDDIEFYVETDKSIYYLGENVEMLYRLTKLGPPSASILCHQDPPLNLVVLKDGKTVWMKVQDWWQWVGELQLFPQIPVEITSSWDMKDLNDVPVEPGTYDVLGVIYDTIGIPDVGVQITILPVPRTITVGLGAGYDFNTIQAAIDDSNDGDTIIVADGTYTGDGNRDIDFLGKAITLRSENGPENCIIDCNGTEIDPHRGFIFQSGEELDSVVEGFTITNGYAPTEETDPPFDIYESVGGAILCWVSSPTIHHCVFTGNSTRSGSSFAFGFGGAISCYADSSPTITNCIFNENSAEHGGGVSNYLGSSPILANCLFSNNSANGSNPDGPGGGMYIDSYSDPVLLNCTFSGNSANGDVGGGIFSQASEPIISNCIFWGNTDTGGTDESAQISYSSGNLVINYTCIHGLTGLFGGIGNIGENPLFVDPCNGDYHLKSQAGRWEPVSESWVQDAVSSPCIDAGNPGCPLGDEPAPNGNRRNMGAYGGTAEASKSPVNWRSIADLTNDWVVDSNDLKVFVSYWLQTGECIPSDLNRNQSTNSADFALLANNWLIDENQ